MTMIIVVMLLDSSLFVSATFPQRHEGLARPTNSNDASSLTHLVTDVAVLSHSLGSSQSIDSRMTSLCRRNSASNAPANNVKGNFSGVSSRFTKTPTLPLPSRLSDL